MPKYVRNASFEVLDLKKIPKEHPPVPYHCGMDNFLQTSAAPPPPPPRLSMPLSATGYCLVLLLGDIIIVVMHVETV